MNSVRLYYGDHLQIPFSFGIYLALNSLKGARLVMDGPMCAFYKSEFIQGNHQLDADLQRQASLHRVLHSELDIQRVILGDEGLVREKLLSAGLDAETQVVLFSAMSSASLIGRDIGRLVNEIAPKLPVPLVAVPARAFFGDWLDGYAETLNALASSLVLPPCAARADGEPLRVGVVGQLYTRDEGDAQGDVAELKRLIEALGPKVVSVWLSGQSYLELAAISQADLLISLPYARKAAKTLAKRLDRPLIELDLPFSIAHTERFVMALAAYLGAEERGRAFLEREKRRMAAAILVRAERNLLGRKCLLSCDPYQVAGWREIVRDFGAEVQGMLIVARKRSLAEDLPEEYLPDGRYPVLDAPSDVLIGNALVMGQMGRNSGIKTYEFGFPCFARHPLVETPSYGIWGEALLAEDLAALLRSP